ncbi:MAG: hypothetical protein IT292_03900 [Deltaproteobacteria bacterium]|nr:hypothetical protein [Deltaproteobacteria bacterium]
MTSSDEADCLLCSGHGLIHEVIGECSACKGAGKEIVDGMPTDAECLFCLGDGVRFNIVRCPTCRPVAQNISA